WAVAYGGFVDTPSVIAFPRPGATPAGLDDVGAAALAEIDAAIALVAGRVARRVRLTAVPFIDTVAGVGVAHARAAGMEFHLDWPVREGVVTVTVGPLETSRRR